MFLDVRVHAGQAALREPQCALLQERQRQHVAAAGQAALHLADGAVVHGEHLREPRLHALRAEVVAAAARAARAAAAARRGGAVGGRKPQPVRAARRSGPGCALHRASRRYRHLVRTGGRNAGQIARTVRPLRCALLAAATDGFRTVVTM